MVDCLPRPGIETGKGQGQSSIGETVRRAGECEAFVSKRQPAPHGHPDILRLARTINASGVIKK